jgi:Flp pilus assembly protein CpaB
MSRRARSLAFAVAALLAAIAAAAIADGYGASVARGYGELRPVVVAVTQLPANEAIDAGAASTGLEVRRVPTRFVPPGTLESPAEALGLVPQSTVPAGSYLLAPQLRPPHPHGSGPAGLDDGRRAVQIAVSGAEPLLVGGAPAGARVDVVVTTETAGAAAGRTYVAAAAVPLLALRPAAEGLGAGGTAAATLGLTRREALRLIAAQSFARQVTLLPRR